jgi:hypothetical protein
VWVGVWVGVCVGVRVCVCVCARVRACVCVSTRSLSPLCVRSLRARPLRKIKIYKNKKRWNSLQGWPSTQANERGKAPQVRLYEALSYF